MHMGVAFQTFYLLTEATKRERETETLHWCTLTLSVAIVLVVPLSIYSHKIYTNFFLKHAWDKLIPAINQDY